MAAIVAVTVSATLGFSSSAMAHPIDAERGVETVSGVGLAPSVAGVAKTHVVATPTPHKAAVTCVGGVNRRRTPSTRLPFVPPGLPYGASVEVVELVSDEDPYPGTPQSNPNWWSMTDHLYVWAGCIGARSAVSPAPAAAGSVASYKVAKPTVTRRAAVPKRKVVHRAVKHASRYAQRPRVLVSGRGNAAANQRIALGMMGSYGWSSSSQFSCLVRLWNRESGWNQYAHNRGSGAHGIPQALPASKMGAAGWSNPVVQIRWGLRYIKGRYGSPCGAWGHSQATGWY